MGFTIEHEGMFSLSEIEIIQVKFIILADLHIVLKIDSIGGHIDAAARNAIPQQVLRNNLGGLIQDWSNPFIVSLIFDLSLFHGNGYSKERNLHTEVSRVLSSMKNKTLK